MKKLTFLLILLPALLSAQDYLVTFSGSTESDTVSTVLVENMTQNESLTLDGKEVLHLKSTVTKISDLKYNQTKRIQIYPNPMKEFSIVKFDIIENGITKVELYDLSGKKLLQTKNYLNKGKHSYRISGIGSGIYVLKVTSGNHLYSGKLISSKKTSEKVNITYQNSIPFSDKLVDTKSANSEITMQYSEGDVLKFTASSGENQSVKVEIISESKNIDFSFYQCTDSDNRNYATVKIGNQIWMAENLAYLPAVSSSSAGSNTEPFYYVYGYQGTNVSDAKATDNYSTYGVLYNWPAALAVCPSGWHLPTDEEWEQLAQYVSDQKGPYSKFMGNFWYDVGKHLKATNGWNNSSRPNNGNGRDDFGFSGLPGGDRNYGGTFYNIGKDCHWWSSKEHDNIKAWQRYLSGGEDFLRNHISKEFGYSVRCIRD